MGVVADQVAVSAIRARQCLDRPSPSGPAGRTSPARARAASVSSRAARVARVRPAGSACSVSIVSATLTRGSLTGGDLARPRSRPASSPLRFASRQARSCGGRMATAEAIPASGRRSDRSAPSGPAPSREIDQHRRAGCHQLAGQAHVEARGGGLGRDHHRAPGRARRAPVGRGGTALSGETRPGARAASLRVRAPISAAADARPRAMSGKRRAVSRARPPDRSARVSASVSSRSSPAAAAAYASEHPSRAPRRRGGEHHQRGRKRHGGRPVLLAGVGVEGDRSGIGERVVERRW